MSLECLRMLAYLMQSAIVSAHVLHACCKTAAFFGWCGLIVMQHLRCVTRMLTKTMYKAFQSPVCSHVQWLPQTRGSRILRNSSKRLPQDDAPRQTAIPTPNWSLLSLLVEYNTRDDCKRADSTREGPRGCAAEMRNHKLQAVQQSPSATQRPPIQTTYQATIFQAAHPHELPS